MKAVFGTEQPMESKRLPDAKRPSYMLTVPAHQYQAGATTAIWDALTMQVVAQPKGRIDISGSWPNAKLADKGGAFEMRDMRFTGWRKGDGWDHLTTGEISNMRFLMPDGSQSIEFRGNRLSTSFERKGKRALVRIDMASDTLAAAGETVEQMHFGMRWRNLDVESLTRLREIMNSPVAKQDVSIVQGLFTQLARRGAAIELDDVSAVYQGSKVSIKGSLSMPNAKLSYFSDRESILKRLDLTLQFKAPLTLLRRFAYLIAQRIADKGGSNPPDDQAVTTAYEALLGKLIANNYARLEKGVLISDVVLKGGILEVNGTTMPLQALLSFFDEGDSPPPEDMSKPEHIWMHARGVEAVRLFALNGDRDGLANMCYRYFHGIDVPKDHAEALKWCSKGSAKEAVWSSILLGVLHVEGEGIPHDPAAGARILESAADVHKVAYAQYKLYQLYEGGIGVPMDRKKAQSYLRLAAEGGEEKAIEIMQRIDPTYKPAKNTAEPPGSPWVDDSDVDAGRYIASHYRFDPAKRRHLTLVLSDLKKHEKWLPMQSICLASLEPSEKACLYLSRNGQNGADLYFYAVTKSADAETSRQRVEADRTFAPGEQIQVEAYVQGGKAYFRINGEQTLEQEITFPVQTMTLACSTAKCHFGFRQP